MPKINYWQKFEEGGYYHIYNRGINKTSIFLKNDNFKFFLRKWEYLINPFFDSMAYCLMPNHFHFLVRVKPYSQDVKRIIEKIETSKSNKLIAGQITYNEFLEDQFKRIFSSYALAFNNQQNRTGSLFQKRFKRVGIHNELKVLHILAYIHHNPIHHKFTREYDSWKFSSYNSYARNKSNFTNKAPTLFLFDKDREKARRLFIQYHVDYKLFMERNEA